MAHAILAAAARMGGLDRVVLGHADTDRRGSAPALAAMAPVVCHPDAVAEAQGAGGRTYWQMSKLPPHIRLLHHVLHRRVWDGGPVQISSTVRGGDEIAVFEVVELPGHAPGQIGLWRASDRVALVSDCFYMTTMLGRPTEPHVPLDAYDLDLMRAHRTVGSSPDRTTKRAASCPRRPRPARHFDRPPPIATRRPRAAYGAADRSTRQASQDLGRSTGPGP